VTEIDTASLRARLEEERARLTGAARFLDRENPGTMEEELGELTDGSADNHLGDMATITYDRELDDGLEEGVQQTLAEIDAAFERLDAGTYGLCEVCGKPIGADRLNAIPWARLCIDDQRKRG
jgi:RNA polymerase-binding transcription factor DksA